MESATAPTLELIATRNTESAVRGVRLDGTRATFRQSPVGIIPGLQLTIAPRRVYTWRRTQMICGDLRSKTFSLRALASAGFALPRFGPRGLVSPGESDDRLIEALTELIAGEWTAARAQLIDVLEVSPGCLVAHARLGLIASALEHRDDALSHLTAAVRLGMGALAQQRKPLHVDGRAGRALLEALRGRAEIFLLRGDVDAALGDLQRAMAWDPSDSLDLGGLLEVARAHPGAHAAPPAACS